MLNKLVIDLDNCDNIYIKKHGEEYTLEDYIYKLVLLSLCRQEEEKAELNKKMMEENESICSNLLKIFGFDK